MCSVLSAEFVKDLGLEKSVVLQHITGDVCQRRLLLMIKRIKL